MFVRKSARSQLHNVINLVFFVMLLIFLSFPSYAYNPKFYDISSSARYVFSGSNGAVQGSAFSVYPVSRLDWISGSSGTLNISGYTGSVSLGSQTLTIGSEDRIEYTESTSGSITHGSSSDHVSSTTTGSFNFPSRSVSLDISGTNFNTFSVPSHSVTVSESYNYDHLYLYELPVYLIFSGLSDVGLSGYFFTSGSFTFDLSYTYASDVVFTPDVNSGSRIVALGNKRYFLGFNSRGNLAPDGLFFTFLGTLSFYSSDPAVGLSLVSFPVPSFYDETYQGILSDIANSIISSPSVPSDYGTVNSGISAGINNVDNFESNVFQNFDVAISDTGMDTFSLSGLQSGFSLYSSIVNALYEGSGSLYKTLITLSLFCIIVPALLGITHKIRGGGG